MLKIEMRCAALLAVFGGMLLFSSSQTQAENIQSLGMAGKLLTLPEVEMSKKTRRQIRNWKKTATHLGALAVNEESGGSSGSSVEQNSILLAEEIALGRCRKSSKTSPDGCRLVAIIVPKPVSGSFQKLRSFTGLSRTCESHFSAFERHRLRKSDTGFFAANELGACAFKFGHVPVDVRKSVVAGCEAIAGKVLDTGKLNSKGRTTVYGKNKIEYIVKKSHMNLNKCTIIAQRKAGD